MTGFVFVLWLCKFILVVYSQGVSSRGSIKIVGGFETQAKELKHQVSLLYGGQLFCGGSLISNRWVLTAAHCIQTCFCEKSFAQVGSLKPNSAGEKYAIERCVPHEHWDRELLRNDIAAIKLATNVIFNDFTRPIHICEEHISEGVALHVYGWGLTSFPGKPSTALMTLNTTSISNEDCVQSFTDYPGISITYTNLCTKNDKGQGTCYGDSGSGIVRTDMQCLAGIVSYGIPCALGKPDMFARLTEYRDWVKHQIELYAKPRQ